ncbi:hypothetical protein GLO35_17340 [Escherichia coli]|uniref:YadA C-terminal domain-containing protein n=1 Tax=Escherichia coli TaxID=562 RepID=UPI002AC4A257|nr:YadA C-terminal domain-containing protein [Escherichia coli]MDZ4887665.1 hypothetical protein [Escherichia coli]MDZ4929230.1 hypothetical protein [Escherichia coli]MDZ4945481.1 hypothetical protein [Escherichia coli]MDZ4952614.1 hypothetical protein [Escherichia coli]MDZ4961108.1 hypothetical protein [Escherichia coli]
MSKIFTKTILSSAIAGLLLASSGAVAQSDYTIKFSEDKKIATIVNGKVDFGAVINTEDGTVTTVNKQEVSSAIDRLYKEKPYIKAAADKDPNIKQMVTQSAGEAARYVIDLPSNFPSLKLGSIEKLTPDDIQKIASNIKQVSEIIKHDTAPAYRTAIQNGMSTESALAAAKDGNPGLLNEFNRLGTNVNQLKDDTSFAKEGVVALNERAGKVDSAIDNLAKETSFALDSSGNITLDEKEGTGERYSVKNTVVDIKADTTVYQSEDGSYTLDSGASKTVRVNDAIVDLDKNLKDRTTVGVNADGSLTRTEGAKNTIGVSEGLVALSGKTERLDAAVGSVDRRVTDVDHRVTGVDRRVTKNTQAIQNHSRQLQEHNARLNSQQRQIRENHEEMKRAAAQSAALAGLFQPYSVGKFNATAALGGYSDKQAVAVGVGYRFNEQTAAKAGVAASDGDVSYNVGVNFEF